MTALNFPSNPSDGDTYENYVYDATVGVWRILVPARGQLGGLDDINFSSLTAGDKLVFDGTNWVNLTGYVLVDTVYFTSNGTFTKATYPWLRAIRVKCQGGGGGGGGAAATTSTQMSVASAAQGGNYAETFLTNISGLSASVTVTVGLGGSGGTAGNNDGNAGGTSSFASLITAGGGREGIGGAAGTPPRSRTSNASDTTTSGGSFVSVGAAGDPGWAVDALFIPGNGGSSFLGVYSQRTIGGNANSRQGPPGLLFGGGGSGGGNGKDQLAVAGGTGAAGIVILELFA
jgi:hypothetical protein